MGKGKFKFNIKFWSLRKKIFVGSFAFISVATPIIVIIVYEQYSKDDKKHLKDGEKNSKHDKDKPKLSDHTNVKDDKKDSLVDSTKKDEIIQRIISKNQKFINRLKNQSEKAMAKFDAKGKNLAKAENHIFDKATLKKYGFEIISFPKNLKLEYSHDPFYLEGILDIKVTPYDVIGNKQKKIDPFYLKTNVYNMGEVGLKYFLKNILKIDFFNNPQIFKWDKSHLPSNSNQFSSKDIIKRIKDKYKYSFFSLLKDNDITLENNDLKGEKQIIFKNHGENKTFKITGFHDGNKYLSEIIKNLTMQKGNYHSNKTQFEKHTNVALLKKDLEKYGFKLNELLDFISFDYSNELLKKDGDLILDVKSKIDGVVQANNQFQLKINITGIQDAKFIAFLSQLKESDFSELSLDKKHLPSDQNVSKKNICDIIESKINNKNLKGLLIEKNIVINKNDSNGTLEFKINHKGKLVAIKITRFLTSKDKVLNDINEWLDTVQKSKGEFTAFLPIKKTSEKEIPFYAFGNYNITNKLSPSKDLILKYTTDGLEYDGTLTWHVKALYNDIQIREFDVKIKVTGINNSKINDMIGSLTKDNFASLPWKTEKDHDGKLVKLSSKQDKVELTNKILEIVNSKLPSPLKNILNSSNIELIPNDEKGILTISIKNHDKQNEFQIEGFISKSKYDEMLEQIKGFEFLKDILAKGLLELEKEEFLQIVQSINNSEIIQKIIEDKTGFRIQDLFTQKGVSPQDILHIYKIAKENGLVKIDKKGKETLNKIIEFVVKDPNKANLMKDLLNKLIKAFQSDLKTVLKTDHTIVEKIFNFKSLSNNSSNSLISSIDYKLLIEKFLYDGFKKKTGSTKPEDIIQPMIDTIWKVIDKANLIKIEMIPKQAIEYGIDLPKVKELLKKAISKILLNLVISTSDQYKGRNLDQEIKNAQAELPKLEFQMNKNKEEIESSNATNKLKELKKTLDKKNQEIANFAKNNPYLKLLKEVGLSEEIIKDLDNQAFQSQLGSGDDANSKEWYKERTHVDAAMAMSIWYRYKNKVKSKGIKTKTNWLQKIGKLHYEEDGWFGDGTDVRDYIKTIISSSEYSKFESGVQKIQDAYDNDDTMFENKGVDPTSNNDIEELKQQIEDLESKTKAYKDAKQAYEDKLNSIKLWQIAIKRMEFERKTNFNSKAMMENEFFNGKGIIYLSKNDINNLLSAFSWLIMDFSNIFDKSISQAIDEIEINWKGNFITQGFAAAFGPGMIKTAIKDLNMVKQIKHSRFLKMFDNIDVKILSELIYNMFNANIQNNVNNKQLKNLLKFLGNLSDSWKINLQDDTFDFLFDVLFKGYNESKLDNNDKQKMIKEISEKLFGVETNDKILDLIVKSNNKKS